MKIVIAGGTHEAEYIVHMFHNRGNKLIVINPSKDEAALLLQRESVRVYVGTPWKSHILEEADAYDADVFIALCDRDTDNYVACQLAKMSFNAKKCICVVNNPNNVELYKSLGIDSVISSTYLLGNSVKNESSVEDIIRAISIENNQVMMLEMSVLPKFRIAEKKIMDLNFPKYASISCIVRKGEFIIPNGQVYIHAKDKLMIVCSPENESAITAWLKLEKSEEERKAEELASSEQDEVKENTISE
ncbi:MAG: NAD-binding protein [Bacilli bacterium]|nr:NAD-binding protein [Bacilli bacterium]